MLGYVNGIKPRHIISAISKKYGTLGLDVGNIEIKKNHTVLEIPEDVSKKINNIKISGKTFHILSTGKLV